MNWPLHELYILWCTPLNAAVHVKVGRYVERYHGGLGLHLDCWLLAVGCSSKCMDLTMYDLGGFAKGLISGAIVCISLL